MKKMSKYLAALAVVTLGSVVYGNLPAYAGGIELDRVDITFKRDNGNESRGHMPPPPPPEYGAPRGHMPPPPQAHGFNQPGPHGGPGGPRGHMPPPPPHGDPRGHMPPPPPHRW